MQLCCLGAELPLALGHVSSLSGLFFKRVYFYSSPTHPV
jgi:hypothetical protein